MTTFSKAVWRRIRYLLPLIVVFIFEQLVGWIAGKWADQIASQPGVKRAAQLSLRWVAERPESVLWTAILLTILWIVWLARREASLRVSEDDDLLSFPPPTRVPAPESFVPRPPPRLEDNWAIDILEVLYRRSYGDLLSPDRGWYILLRLRIINRGRDEPAIAEWKLDVTVGTAYARTAEVVTVPLNWIIKRLPPGYGTAIDEPIDRPTLDERTRNDGVYRGRPLTGWVLFELLTYERVGAPHNARLKLRLTDALGGEHTAVVEPDMYKERATIDVDSAGVGRTIVPSAGA